MPAAARTITLPGGRRLCYAEWGDLDGQPVISLHGTPGCRLSRFPNEDLVRSLGAHVVTYDRPGYGRSDRHRGRRVADCAADVAALADAVGFKTFAVKGGSGGGPHCLAVAALLPDRVTRALAQVSFAPYDALGAEFMTGMDPLNVSEYSWALEGEERLQAELEREAREMEERVAKDPSTVLGDFDLPDADREILSRADLSQVIRESTAEQCRNGPWGWVDDDIAFVTPWGFDPATITVPAAIWWSRNDVLVPPQHGEWLARTVPDARTYVDDAGHQGENPEAEQERMYAWLFEGRH